MQLEVVLVRGACYMSPALPPPASATTGGGEEGLHNKKDRA